jgi:hypothetical protein
LWWWVGGQEGGSVAVCEKYFSEDYNIIIPKYAVDMRRAATLFYMQCNIAKPTRYNK